MMVAAGFGVCFLPEYSPTIPGVRTQLMSDPEVVREVSLVSMSGRRFSPAVRTLSAVQSTLRLAPDNGPAGCDAAYCGQQIGGDRRDGRRRADLRTPADLQQARPARSSRSDARRRARGRCRHGNIRRTAGGRGNPGRRGAAASRRIPAGGRLRPSGTAVVRRRDNSSATSSEVEVTSRPGRAFDREIVAIIVVEPVQRLDQQEIDRHPDRPAPIRIAAEQVRVSIRPARSSMLKRLPVVLEDERIALVILRERADAVVGQELGLVEHAPQQALHAVAAQQRQQMPLLVARARSSARPAAPGPAGSSGTNAAGCGTPAVGRRQFGRRAPRPRTAGSARPSNAPAAAPIAAGQVQHVVIEFVASSHRPMPSRRYWSSPRRSRGNARRTWWRCPRRRGCAAASSSAMRIRLSVYIAIQAVPSDWLMWPPVGSGALRSKMPILSSPRKPP